MLDDAGFRDVTAAAQNLADPSPMSDSRADSRTAIKAELAGRLCFDDEGVFRRLVTERVADDFVTDCFSKFIQDSTYAAHWKMLRDIVARAEAAGQKNEKAMYQHLEPMLNYIGDYQWDDFKWCPGGIPRRFVCTSEKELSSEVHTLGFPSVKPDISLLDAKRLQSIQGKGRTSRRGRNDIIPRGGVIVQVSLRSNRSLPRAADYARLHMAARPFQLFSVGLLIYGLKFCVAIFDRTGATFSPEGSLDNTEGLKLFMRVVRCFTVTMTDEDLGRDPTTELVPLTHPALLDLQAEARSLGITVHDNFPTFTVSLGDGTNNRWITVAMIWSSLSLLGRGTTVWLVKRLQNVLPQGSVRIMKTAWRSNRRIAEADIYKSLQSAQNYHSHPCVAQFDAGGDVRFQNSGISVSTLRRTILGLPQDSLQEDKILHRVFLSTVGRPVWEYEREELLIRGIKAAIQGHKFFCEQGTLHRDISAGNVLLAVDPQPGCEGFITDLDYAAVSDKSPSAKTPRMSAWRPDYLIINEVRDDLESFLWVFCYAVMRHYTIQYPSDDVARKEFSDTFGRLKLTNILRSRYSCDPIRSMWRFDQGVSPQLLTWFEHQMDLTMDRSTGVFHWRTGFNFTHEVLSERMDTALSAVLNVHSSSTVLMPVSCSTLSRAPHVIQTPRGRAVQIPLASFLHNVLPPLQPGLDPMKVVNTLLRARKQSSAGNAITRDGRWRGFPQDPSKAECPEDISFRPLRNVSRGITRAAGLKKDPMSFHHNPTPRMLSDRRDISSLPDVYFLNSDEQTPNWRNIAVLGELKKAATFDDIEDVCTPVYLPPRLMVLICFRIYARLHGVWKDACTQILDVALYSRPE
ncbi:hypothetical protein NM688_g6348 [Phlebia brevispora]|uniref:Uncharacterized protein n=1 Tax=Phlebia brevispora TaxID=194682 RepID=A0ACC1SH07_9APHY|nr:hypothetical protein NM688_g6348 [Phlebia brevispora]